MHKSMECGCAVIVLLASVVSSAQVGAQFRTLVVNDQSGKAAVLKMGDKTYVDLKRLVQIVHGSVAFEGDRIVVEFSCAAPMTQETGAQPEPPTSPRLTQDFMKAGIEEISLLREWASTLANAMQNGYPVSDNWIASYRGQAQTGLGTASATASNEPDRSAFQLLNKEFDLVQEWSNKLMEARKSMDAAKYALSPTALKDDPHSQKIVSCAHFLGQMLASGTFQDDASCH
jgi:hypothetical protein